MQVDVVSLTDRPELLEPSFAIGPPQHAFMQRDLTGLLYTAGVLTRWADFTLVLVSGDQVLARASTVPFAMGIDGREELPDDGFDGVLRWAAEDVLAEREPNCVAALEISVAVEARSQGVSALALDAVRALARRRGFDHVVCPVRPTEKERSPRMSMAEYIELRREDGLPIDPWLRVHVRAGGDIVGIAPFSMTVSGSLGQWKEWTGIHFDQDGEVDVSGALAPVIVNRRRDLATYIEPNVWVRHRTTTDL